MTTITITLNERGSDRQAIIKKILHNLVGILTIEGKVLTCEVKFDDEALIDLLLK